MCFYHTISTCATMRNAGFLAINRRVTNRCLFLIYFRSFSGIKNFRNNLDLTPTLVCAEKKRQGGVQLSRSGLRNSWQLTRLHRSHFTNIIPEKILPRELVSPCNPLIFILLSKNFVNHNRLIIFTGMFAF